MRPGYKAYFLRTLALYGVIAALTGAVVVLGAAFVAYPVLALGFFLGIAIGVFGGWVAFYERPRHALRRLLDGAQISRRHHHPA